MLEAKSVPEPDSLIGTWRRFGLVGPVYEIVGVGTSRLKDGMSMRVRILETDEELDYPLADIMDDPPADTLDEREER